MVTLPGSKTTDELDERLCVRMCQTSIDVDADFIDTIHKLQVEWLQQLVLHKLLSAHALSLTAQPILLSVIANYTQTYLVCIFLLHFNHFPEFLLHFH